jgi:hypothetical protein
MTASLASLTVPVIVPRASCALADAGASETTAAKTAMAHAYNNFDTAGFILILLVDGNKATATRLRRTCRLGRRRRRIEAILERRCPGKPSHEPFPLNAIQGVAFVVIVVNRDRPGKTMTF